MNIFRNFMIELSFSRNNLCLLKIVLYILFGTFSLFSNAQIISETRHLTVNDGLSNNSVRAFFQDKQGFMWFGTYDGLNKYDGHLVKVFRNRIADSTSLPYNYIYSISEDAKNNIWVGTGQGIGIYSPSSEKFSAAYYMPSAGGNLIKLTTAIQVIVKDHQGNMLVGSNNQGLFLKYHSADHLVQIPYQDERGKLIFDLNVGAIVQGANNDIWISAAGVGICKLNIITKKFVSAGKGPGDIACLAYNNNQLWTGTRSGLFQYNIINGKLISNQSTQLKYFNGKSIISLMVEGQKIWIGIEGGGISIYDIKTKTSVPHTSTIEGEAIIDPGATVNLFLDRYKRKWIGSLKRGVCFIDGLKNPFQIIRHQRKNYNTLVSNDVSCFAEMDSENLWIGTSGSGLSLWNRRDNRFTNFMHKPGEKKTLSNNNITSILQDSKGITWISTYGGGINKYNKRDGTFTHYQCVIPRVGENNYPWLLYEDHANTLWVGTFVGGFIYRYNRSSDMFELFDTKLANVISMTEDSNHFLWVADSRYLVRVDQKEHRHTIYNIGKPIRAIHEDKEKNFWLGTESGGLLLFDRKSGNIKERLSEADGLSNNSVLNILEDNSGNLWLSTFFGLSRFDKKKKTFQNYYKRDGLSSSEFSYNSAFKLNTGEMIFGGIEGFTLFHPDSLASSKLPFTIPYLASIEIDHRPLDSTTYSSGKENQINRIILPFDKTAISMSISSIDFSSSGERRFLYYLDSWDKRWTAAQSSSIINYSRLDEGLYKLHARSYNNIGKLGPDTIILEILVLPPWYKTLWAYLLYAAVVVSSIYAYNAYRVRQAELKYEAKLSIQNALNEKEINERKLKFFTEVSHEFRTPLTLIINPLREYLRHHSNTAQIEDLQRVYTNAQRLLGLVDQLLLFRKVGANSDDLRIAKLSFEIICREIFNSFVDEAKIKQLKYKLNIKRGPIELYADREKIEIIIYNLLSNAIKFTPIGGTVMMRVAEEDDVIRMSFSDTGPGIPKNVGDKLFEQFYQVPETKSASGNGFGIGLYLVKYFVNRHRALISYESYVDCGSTFHLTLLKGFQHLSEYTIHKDIHHPSVDLAPVTKSIPENTTLDIMLNKRKSILIVEDNHELLDFLISILHDKYNVYKSTSGTEAFELTKQYMPDVIITDIMMERGNGLDLCRKVKNDQLLGHIPVILLTALTDSVVRLTGVESGADDYITKPFQSDLLLARVKILLENQSKLQDYFYNEITLKKHDFNIPPEYAEFLNKCISVINNYLSDEDFNIKKLSSEIGMSHSALYRKVKVISGESIAGFIRFIRLRKAAELMINTDYPVNEIAFLVGMSDQKYFRTKFSGLFRMNPSDYIKKYRPGAISRARKK